MNNKKVYIYLYYFALILSIFTCIIPSILKTTNTYVNLSRLSFILILINAILIIIFTILLIKRKLNNTNIIFPIIYILFTIIVLIICILFNQRLIIPYIQFSYYIKLILINYLLLNIYSILSINKKTS